MMIIPFSLFYIHNIIYLLFIYLFFNFGETWKSECNIIAIINTSLIFDIIVKNNCLEKLKNYFTIFISFSKKDVLFVNDYKLPNSTGPDLLRNKLTLEVKQQNHRII